MNDVKNDENNVYFKCEACNEYYKFRSTLRRHLRAHAFDRRLMKRLLKTTPSVRGGGVGKTASDDDDDEDDVPLAQTAQRSLKEPILPEKWGCSTREIELKTPDFDGEALADLVMNEIDSEIKKRRDSRRRRRRNGDPRDDDPDYSTLSMLAALFVMFYKTGLGANLGEDEQRRSNRGKPAADTHDRTGDDDETLIDAWFHSHPVLLLQGNLEDELVDIAENFALQIYGGREGTHLLFILERFFIFMNLTFF